MKPPIFAVFRMQISLHSADCDCAAAQRIMNRKNDIVRCGVIFICLFVLGLFSGCSDNLLLPTGGYDYRMSSVDGAILGYPIPRTGPNPYCYDLPLTEKQPSAFAYDSEKMEYFPLETARCVITLPHAEISVPCVRINEHLTFFALSAREEQITVYQGDIGGKAVVLSHVDGILYLADESGAVPIAEDVLGVWQVYTEQDCLLFFDQNSMLYEYKDGLDSGSITQISDGGRVDWAWYAYGCDRHTVVFRQRSSDSTDDVWYYAEDAGKPVPCIIPPKESSDESAVLIRGTASILQGTNDTAYVYDIRTGKKLEMDMGGLYRFPLHPEQDTEGLTLSPDGRFVYFYDIDFIYRLNLETGNLALAYNEAPVFEGSCILSSMTPVTDEIVLLSQAANEYTEYVPTMTCAIFEEDIPEVRHEDEKIDLDYHPWETDD
jgi:hypothetical protein